MPVLSRPQHQRKTRTTSVILRCNRPKNGNVWHFGMKMHIGVDDSLGLIHNIVTTLANEHDITKAGHLLHGEEKRVWADSGYVEIEKREEHKGRDVDWFIAMHPGKRSKLPMNSDEAQTEKTKASTRAKVEHAFSVIKQLFGYNKVRYCGLAKNQPLIFISRLCQLATYGQIFSRLQSAKWH